nr:Coenzyme F420 hydrogenase/dehydrogenase, beta subunit C-terminal domain [uncultured Marinifilum sp.]
MHNKLFTDKIVDLGLCLGCGICTAISADENAKMVLHEDGFLYPNITKEIKEDEKLIKKICPGYNLISKNEKNNFQKLWGECLVVEEGYACDNEVRGNGASGGYISAIAICLLETGKVDAVLHVGGDANNYEANNLKVSKSKLDIIKYSSSRYAPALVFDCIKQIMDDSADVFCFVGKPCDISTLNRFLLVYPQYSGRIYLTISIFCAGMPSFNATKNIISSFNAKLPVKDLQYRGKGWPGFFTFTDKRNEQFSMTYNDSWGNVLGRKLCFRCKICPDGIGLVADFAIGDSWETKDGYPDFEEKEGKSLVICRTEKAVEILDFIKLNKAVESNTLDVKKLPIVQPYQFRRRQFVGVRALAFSFAKFVPMAFSSFMLFKQTPLNRPVTILREFIGTFSRSRKI